MIFLIDETTPALLNNFRQCSQVPDYHRSFSGNGFDHNDPKSFEGNRRYDGSQGVVVQVAQLYL